MNSKYFRNPRTHNEQTQINSETVHFVRAKRNMKHLPDSRSDLHYCEDKDTDRQIRMSHNKFKVSIKHLPVVEDI